MLSKDKRLNLRKDFKWVSSGKKITTKYALLFIKKGYNATPRVGIAISGESFKKATQRSKAKRVVSFAFETLYQRLPQNINIVALPKNSILGVKSQDVLLDLLEKLKNEKIIS